MNYTILIYESADGFAARSDPARRDNLFGPIAGYLQALREAGVFVAGAGLELPRAAKTLRGQGRERLVQDGPFAETKEQLAGFFMIDVPDYGAALDWAKRCPPFPGRVLEVRPNLRAAE